MKLTIAAKYLQSKKLIWPHSTYQLKVHATSVSSDQQNTINKGAWLCCWLPKNFIWKQTSTGCNCLQKECWKKRLMEKFRTKFSLQEEKFGHFQSTLNRQSWRKASSKKNRKSFFCYSASGCVCVCVCVCVCCLLYTSRCV